VSITSGEAHVAVSRLPVATRPNAVAVTGDDSTARGCGDDPGPSAHVDDLRLGAEDNPAHRRVAGECSDGVDGQYVAALGLVKTSGYPG